MRNSRAESQQLGLYSQELGMCGTTYGGQLTTYESLRIKHQSVEWWLRFRCWYLVDGWAELMLEWPPSDNTSSVLGFLGRSPTTTSWCIGHVFLLRKKRNFAGWGEQWNIGWSCEDRVVPVVVWWSVEVFVWYCGGCWLHTHDMAICYNSDWLLIQQQ